MAAPPSPPEPLRFAGVYFSDHHEPTDVSKLDNAKLLQKDYHGVVAISGVVPMLCSDADLANLNPGDELFLGVSATPYCQIVRPDKEADTYPFNDIAFAIAAEYSHQQLVTAAVCLKTPKLQGTNTKTVWGCPKFAPVAIDTNWYNADPVPFEYAVVSGALHGTGDDSSGAYTFLGANVFSVVTRDVLLRTPGMSALTSNEKMKQLENRFIGTYVSKIEDGGGCMVSLGVVLTPTASS